MGVDRCSSKASFIDCLFAVDLPCLVQQQLKGCWMGDDVGGGRHKAFPAFLLSVPKVTQRYLLHSLTNLPVHNSLHSSK
jgi:hypothetical protein